MNKDNKQMNRSGSAHLRKQMCYIFLKKCCQRVPFFELESTDSEVPVVFEADMYRLRILNP